MPLNHIRCYPYSCKGNQNIIRVALTFPLFRRIRLWQVRLNHRKLLFLSFATSVLSVSSVVFRDLISKISKVSGVLVIATRDTKDPIKFCYLLSLLWLHSSSFPALCKHSCFPALLTPFASASLVAAVSQCPEVVLAGVLSCVLARSCS